MPSSSVDFTQVESFGGSSEAFFDGAHIDDLNAGRLIDALFDGGGHALQ